MRVRIRRTGVRVLEFVRLEPDDVAEAEEVITSSKLMKSGMRTSKVARSRNSEKFQLYKRVLLKKTMSDLIVQRDLRTWTRIFQELDTLKGQTKCSFPRNTLQTLP